LSAAAIALQVDVFKDSLLSFAERWNNGATSNVGERTSAQDVVSERLLSIFHEGDDSSGTQIPWLGQGIGQGSNVAAAVKTGDRDFTLGEGEWARITLEFGPLFGILFFAYRGLLFLQVGRASFSALTKGSNLPILLFSVAGPDIILGNMEQPTSLGFMVFGLGLCLAACSSMVQPFNQIPKRVARERKRSAHV
jgi:hypothetical protein